ncbi:MAG: hypothetical protein ACXV4A_09650 [Actinomycetes bacterium]
MRHASPPAAGPAPERAPGLDLLGEERGSGYVHPTYLVRRGDGQVLQLSALLYLTLEHLDGRPLGEVAAAVSARNERELTVEGVEFLVEHKLAPLGLVGHEAPPVDRDAAILTLAGRRTLLPASAVRVVARMFRPLFWSVVIVLVVEAVAVGDYWMFGRHDVSGSIRSVLVHPDQLLVVLALMVASMFFHELGHASGASYGGARPGVVGMGLYVVWPAFYTDVTDAYRLDRGGRLRTDLGGIYFNMVFLVGLLALHARTGADVLVVAAILTHLEILQQLLPVVRLDGYFIVGDLVGVPDLFRWVRPILLALVPGRPRPPQLGRLRRWVRWVVAGWVLLVVPVLAVNVWILATTGPQMLRTTTTTMSAQSRVLSTALHSFDVVTALVTAVSMIALALPLLGLWVLATRLSGRVRRELAGFAARGPRQRTAVAAAVGIGALALAWFWLPDPVRVPTTPAAAAVLRPTAPEPTSSTTSPPDGRDSPLPPPHRRQSVAESTTPPGAAPTERSRRQAAPVGTQPSRHSHRAARREAHPSVPSRSSTPATGHRTSSGEPTTASPSPSRSRRASATPSATPTRTPTPAPSVTPAPPASPAPSTGVESPEPPVSPTP